MLGYNVFAADSDAEADLLATSMMQAFVALRTGTPGQLKPPVPGYYDSLFPNQKAMLDQVLSCSAVGGPEKVAAAIHGFVAETGADELMITCQTYDHAARLRSYEIVAGLIEG